MLSKTSCSLFAVFLIPSLINQACAPHGGYDSHTEVDRSRDSLHVAKTTLPMVDMAGKPFDAFVDATSLTQLANAKPPVPAFMADGKKTTSPLQLFKAADLQLRDAGGEVVDVKRNGNTLLAVSIGKRVDWNPTTRTLTFGSGSHAGTVALPLEFTPTQTQVLASSLAYLYLIDANHSEDPEVHASWGVLIAILVILIGGILLAGAMSQSCCDRAADSCSDMCDTVASFTCSGGVSGGGSADLAGFDIDLSAMCISDCQCGGDFGGTIRQTETW